MNETLSTYDTLTVIQCGSCGIQFAVPRRRIMGRKSVGLGNLFSSSTGARAMLKTPLRMSVHKEDVIVFGADNKFVCDCWELDDLDDQSPSEARAQEIVRLCNTHAELLRACDMAMSAIVAEFSGVPTLPKEIGEAFEFLKVATAKARAT